MTESGVLSGVRVAELGTGIAGAYAAMLLAEQGADVVKMEPPGGDPTRAEPGFYTWNRSKRSVTRDLQAPDRREFTEALASWADVLIASYAPAESAALGLSYDALRERNPRLIVCAMPPMGERGPLRDLPADDACAAAYAGLFADQGGPGEPPVFITLPIPSYGAAFLACYAVTTALFVRERTGVGQQVEVSLLAGALAMESGTFVGSETMLRPRASGDTQRGVFPVYRLYRCQDDWIFIACGNPTFWNKLCLVLGLPELISDPRFENGPWGITPEENRAALRDIVATALAKRPRDEWLRLFQEGDVPCAVVRTRAEFRDDPQVRANDMVVEVIDPRLGHTRQMAIPVRLSGGAGCTTGPAPQPGEHTAEVLAELGLS